MCVSFSLILTVFFAHLLLTVGRMEKKVLVSVGESMHVVLLVNIASDTETQV